MLKFFRRIRQDLIESNNTRKYFFYAIAEIMLVVIGILIALQVNNWNEQRKQRKIEVQVLNDVLENLGVNINRLQSMIERCETDNEASNIIMSIMDRELSYTDSMNHHFYFALNPVDKGPFLSYVGYESLKNIGFEVIQNNQLKKEIINLFEGTYLELLSKYDRIEKLSSPEMVHFRRQHFLFHPDTILGIGLKPIFYSTIIKDARFRSVLTELQGLRGWISISIKQSLQDTKRVHQLIKDEYDQFGK